ncbi:transcription-repair coupling factor [Sporolactobacillus spathodeae]|uniref:Transcription-repair-coupling factor n=1 Tax=Sporolactobacillus spathodeae TaxID=1465502 RepID=A0ABS2QB72_9BACL|nr:transcription-repair coupling factor [Sporolactobacillus spathodeae]MBM7658826.1 transcription-repair coupling factor (superfamily II helicase) [Sporolactobacillus spathodeae]
MRGLGIYFKQKLAEFEAVRDGFENGMKQQLISGLSGSAKSLLIAAFYHDNSSRSLIAVAHNLFQGQKMYNDLQGLIDSEELLLYPTNDMIASDLAVSSPELLAQRIHVLNRLAEGKRCLIVVPIAGLKRLMAPFYLWKASLMRFKSGETLDLAEIASKLSAIGYEREPMITSPGQYSIRGGILDIFPLTERHPLRIELFDDEVDSIRFFDSESQRSIETLTESPIIGPARELLLYDEQYVQGSEQVEQKLSLTLSRMKNEQVKQLLHEQIGAEVESLRQKQTFEGIGKYSALLYNRPATLTDYSPENALIIMDEISRIQEMSDQLDHEEAEWQLDQLQRGRIVADSPLMRDGSEWVEQLRQPVLLLSLFLRYHGHFQPQNVVTLSSRSMENFHGQINLLKTETDRWLKSDYALVFLASDSDRAERMEQVLQDYQIDAALVDSDCLPTPGKIHIMQGILGSGFEIPLRKLAVITEQEVFTSKLAKKAHKGKRLSNAERLRNYNELSIGDYVVHVDHGIGRYAGVETLEVNGIHKDYLKLIYKGNDKLYVPVEHIDQVQKYVSAEGKEPKIYSLGGSEWKKVKSRARSSIQNIADDLIKLYAKREASRGHAFSSDGPEQHDFETAFPYQETVDQLQAIEEIKKDMESERPMDRLLCGDVGYGKTEVALRAAFKAIAGGKQVAFLVPTTILAQQHFETARERFEDFPVSIGVLSRFRSRKEKLETLRGLKDGTIDLIIGTHRLLSKDVVFKDLGLLVVDEEQRFGVTHKEKIKQLKANVDVLTLTATPIPRTLHMSMLGVRDLSVIETPPENRFPVQTYVTEYSGSLIREAIERELARGGQVYFLYNRVETIQHMAEVISQLVPDATVTVAHGQMKETELESAMIDFLDGTSDVLVSTTIIETGVDIPNVNTLIVYDADRMGLSQLYQLRGRVGRSSRVAYAYFTYQRDKVMNEVAEKRLQAIKEFTELGSGFKIAMRDLSIRGAGNLLGAEQHGFIDSVGFDLYSQMLRDAVAERKGSADTAHTAVRATLAIETDAYIPDTYIEDSIQKIDMYKRFKAADSISYLEELQDEMIDRFGDYPVEVADLFKVAAIRVLADKLMIEEIKEKASELLIVFSEMGWKHIDRQALFQYVSTMGPGIGVGSDGARMKLSLKRGPLGSKRLDHILDLLKKVEPMQIQEQTAG